jgi:hypothetical protein
VTGRCDIDLCAKGLFESALRAVEEGLGEQPQDVNVVRDG